MIQEVTRRYRGRLGRAVGRRRAHEHHSARRRQHLQRLVLRDRHQRQTCRATTSTRSCAIARLVSTSSVKSNWEVNPAFGGPLKRDKFWFFASGRYSEVNNYVAGAVRNANAGNASSFAYAPDTSFRGSRDTLVARRQRPVTWQATPEEQGQPVRRLPGPLQLHRRARADVARGVGRLHSSRRSGS